MTFDDIFMLLMKHEGGYVNDPSDRGGETKYGISKRSYPWLNIKLLTESDAYDIYWRDYWMKPGIFQLPFDLAWPVFDMAVNAGPVAAIRILQREAGVRIDGVLGRETIEASKRRVFSLTYTTARLLYYADIVNRMPSQRKFLPAWIRRSMDVLNYAHGKV